MLWGLTWIKTGSEISAVQSSSAFPVSMPFRLAQASLSRSAVVVAAQTTTMASKTSGHLSSGQQVNPSN